MGTTRTQRSHRSRRQGIALVYTTVMMTVLMGFCSLAVDLARVQASKTELHRAADAAAIYAAHGLASGNAVSNAIQAGKDNKVDGQPLTILGSDVTLGTWNGSKFIAGGASPNAVKVQTYRTKARNNAISLVFAQLIGQATCDVHASAIAFVNTQSTTQTVAATSNPYLAGEPLGTKASMPDSGYKGPQVNSQHPWQYDIAGPIGGKAASGQPYNSPQQFPISLQAGAALELTNVTGSATNDPTFKTFYAATGNDVGSGIYDDEAAEVTGSEHGMSQLKAPLNSMIGVFLTDNAPDNDGAIPPALDFSTTGQRDYTTLKPELRQPFYIGNGQTSNGVQQNVIVPKGATRFYIATWDGHEWSNNLGSFTATVDQTRVELVQ
jgi:Flp pilus assembly protein TadG